MKKQYLLFAFVLATGLVALVGVSFFHHMAEEKRYATRMMTYSIGKEMIDTTNSSLVTTIGPELRAQLSQLLASTTHIATVRLGDEPPPLGDGRASSTITLTNALAQGLGIRLRLGSDAMGHSKFNVLGYWAFSSETNRAAGSSGE